jgi:predicted nucleic acid-binding protein
VTVQELLVLAAVKKKLEPAREQLLAMFSVLPFDERAALAAAELAGNVPPLLNAIQQQRDHWHRDIAILGTAAAHDMARLVTANEKDFARYRDLVVFEIEALKAIPRRG